MRYSRLALAAIAGGALCLPASAQTLYDAGLGTLPAAQGWTSILVGVAESHDGGAARLDSGALNATQGGYGWTATPLSSVLSVVRLRAQVVSEAHASVNRAGYSLIVLTENLQGIELGFWTDRIFAQNVGFTHGEEALFDTTAALTDYNLRLGGGTYELRAGGVPILSGALRDYSAFGFPYNTPSFLFVGDDTTSARAVSRTASIGVNAPEPSAAALLALGLLGGVARRRRR